jgi:deoxyribodipyrimidine photo-lyase
VFRRGPLVATALRLARDCDAASVVLALAYDAATLARQRALQSALEEAGLRATLVHDAPAVSPEETAAARSDGAGRGYRSFAPYFAAWSAQPRTPLATRPTFAPHAVAGESLPEPAEFGQVSGVVGSPANVPSEDGALAALDAYLAGPVFAYASARMIPGGEPTARLSASLGLGTIAARTVLARIDARARDPFLLAEERFALRALTRALAQRDFFLQLAWFFEASPDAPLQERMRRFPFAASHRALAAWTHGRTGFPLVDAGVRQLRTTGWMHPRVRLVAASFLCFDLGVDWRVGRDLWERELEEDDYALATGNWQWIAGVGADLAQFPRIYNPGKQARALDPSGSYVRRYVAELANVPEHQLFGGRAERPQMSLPLYDDAKYPEPMLDHDVEARAFLRRYARYATEPDGGGGG